MGAVLDKLREQGVVEFGAGSREVGPYGVPDGQPWAVSGTNSFAFITKPELLALAKEIEELAETLD